ncbi:MAG: hypothetical protein P1V97_33660 [Planctomycetota bacterium]|nr:hypothetical protein [Planctomycetota bacterium]
MPFQEKSAWIMSLALLLSGLIYSGAVVSISKELGHFAPPVLPVLVIFTVILTVIAIIGHIFIAAFAPKDANSPLDEREQKIFDKAGKLSGYVFGCGVILSLGLYILTHDGNLLFYSVFGSLILGQLSEYLIQIVLYRTAI